MTLSRARKTGNVGASVCLERSCRHAGGSVPRRVWRNRPAQPNRLLDLRYSTAHVKKSSRNFPSCLCICQATAVDEIPRFSGYTAGSKISGRTDPSCHRIWSSSARRGWTRKICSFTENNLVRAKKRQPFLILLLQPCCDLSLIHI